jgi:hypothetical protein
MSELRPAVFSEEDEKDSQEDTSALQPDAKMGEQSCASSLHVVASAMDDEWAEAEAAWAAAEADVDAK